MQSSLKRVGLNRSNPLLAALQAVLFPQGNAFHAFGIAIDQASEHQTLALVSIRTKSFQHCAFHGSHILID